MLIQPIQKASFKAFLRVLLVTASNYGTVTESVMAIYTHCLKDLKQDALDERRFENYLSQIYLELKQPMIVWKMLERTNMNNLSRKLPILCYLSSCRNAKNCLSEVVRLQSILLSPTIKIRLLKESDNIVIEVCETNSKWLTKHYRSDFAITLVLYSLRQHVGPDFDYLEIRVPTSRPQFFVDEIRPFTKALIKKHDSPMQAVISNEKLMSNNTFFDQFVHEQWRDKVEKIYSSSVVSESVTNKVISILEANDKPAAQTLDTLAIFLAMSKSTLRRNLESERASFKDIQKRFLHELSVSSLLTTDIDIGALALKLGYSERSTFERGFKQRTGRTPSQFRELAKGVFEQQKDLDIEGIANSMPPLPESCLQLIGDFNGGTLTVDSAVKIIEKDPIFISRVLGLASRAIYGGSPKSLADAVGHKLGLEAVKNLAVVFATKDSLKNKLKGIDVDAHIYAFLAGPRIYQLLRKSSSLNVKAKLEGLNQTLTIGALGFLLMSHKNLKEHSTFAKLVDESEDLQSLFEAVNQFLDYSIFGTSILLLSYWGIGNEVIKNLSKFEQHLSSGLELNEEEKFSLFTFEVMFEVATRNSVTDNLRSRAKNSFAIANIEEIFDELKRS